MTHLLTWHGTVLCRERTCGTLVHRKLTGSVDDADVLDIGDLDEVLQADFGHLMRADEDALLAVPDSGPLTGWTISRAPDHRGLVLSRGGKRMMAPLGDEHIWLVADDAGEASWFLAIGREDLAALRDVLAAKWVVESAGASAQPESGSMTPGFGLRIGALDIGLGWNLPFDRSEWPHRMTLLPEAWRIDRIHRYRPLVYFAAFGDAAIMRQFALSVASLTEFGLYDGAIAVMADKSAAEIRALVPRDMLATLVVIPTAAHDRVGYLAARFTIARWADARDFQPLLYVDTDVVFDLPVGRMLRALALSDRICAAVEPTECLGTSDIVGSGLLLADGCSPGAALGFNSGVLGIPNLSRHGATLALMGRVLHNRLTLCGRDSLPYPDQAIANFVAYRRDAADTALLSEYVRLLDHRADPSGRQGFAHFCWAGSMARKVELMRGYVQRLARMNGGGSDEQLVPGS